MLFNFIHGFCLFLSDKQNFIYTVSFCFLYSFVSDSLFWLFGSDILNLFQNPMMILMLLKRSVLNEKE